MVTNRLASALVFIPSVSEPGYYEDGKFGIRIESLCLVVKTDTKFNFNNKGFLTFEPITLVPIQSKLIDASLLSESEVSVSLYMYTLFHLLAIS
jgi:hypothetical protein